MVFKKLTYKEITESESEKTLFIPKGNQEGKE